MSNEKEILATASIGLVYSRKTGKHYLQIIFADTQTAYLREITQGNASFISTNENILETRSDEATNYGLLMK